jgi:hypothetical protein
MPTPSDQPHHGSASGGFIDSTITPAVRVEQYEFTSRENQVIGKLAKSMGYLGYVLVTFGVVILVIGVFNHHAGMVLSSIGFVCTGIFTLTAAGSFRNVVETKGDDISHLMAALEHLRRATSVLVWVINVGILASIILAVLAHLQLVTL